MRRAVVLLLLLLPASVTAASTPPDSRVLASKAERSSMRVVLAHRSGTVSKTVSVRAHPPRNARQVRFYVDRRLRGVDRKAPYRFHWFTRRFADGKHRLSVVWVDRHGRLSAPTTRVVRVVNAPYRAPRARAGDSSAKGSAPGRAVTPHAPATPAPSSGSVTFEDGFDNQSFDNWDHVQVSCRYATPGSLIDGFVPGLRAGGYAARFHLRHGIRSEIASGNEACEVTKRRESYRLGQTEYYGMRFRIIGPYSEPYQWAVIHQLAYPGVKYHNLGTSLRRSVAVNFQNGRWLGSSYEHATGNMQMAGISPGTWHEFIWKVTWATEQTGGVEIWYRANGAGDWAKVYEEFAVPTNQWGQSEYACVTRQATNCADGSARVTLDKLGAYRAYNPDGQPDLVVDHDAFIVGTGFQAVADKLARS